MKAQRAGTNLKIEIRMARAVLGLDPYGIDMTKMSLAELREMKRELYQKLREAGKLKEK